MHKILVLAQGEYIADYAREVQITLPEFDEMVIEVAHMEEAVRLAREYAEEGVEVIVARSSTARMLRNAKLSIPVVEIPINNDEILNSIRKAQALATPGETIGFLGFKEAVVNIQPFLDLLNFRIKVYDITSSPEVMRQIDAAKRDGVRVVVAGARSVHYVQDAGLTPVLIDTSKNAVATAYRQAQEILRAVEFEKKKTGEIITILNSVSDAIVSLDVDGHVVMVNRLAADIFSFDPIASPNRHYTHLFNLPEQAHIHQALTAGEKVRGEVAELRGTKYALSVSPIIVGMAAEGAIVTLREIRELQRMEASVRKGLYRRGNVARYVFDDIKGGSEPLREVKATAKTYAALKSNVLIIGETGTGKELFAQSIHNAGPRRDGPFVAVNCGAIPSSLIESELFGYEEGAFTGSKKGGRMGLFELAHKGTIFLDEISEMDKTGQINLLRALQERQIRRVGGDAAIPVDVRVIAASNVDLNSMVRENRFRRDLFYRLSVLVMNLPPLRARVGDVSVIAKHFIQRYAHEFGKPVVFTNAGLRLLESFSWEGNIRQLRNFCERIVAVAPEIEVGEKFIKKLFHDSFQAEETLVGRDEQIVVKGRVLSRTQICDVLRECGGNRRKMADELGVSRTTIWKLLKEFDAQDAGEGNADFGRNAACALFK